MTLLEFLNILLNNFLQIINPKNQTHPQFQLHLTFPIFKYVLPDRSHIEIVGDDPLHKLLMIFIRPVKTFLGVEVGMVQRGIFVAYLGTRKSCPHLLCIGFVVDLRGFDHLYSY